MSEISHIACVLLAIWCAPAPAPEDPDKAVHFGHFNMQGTTETSPPVCPGPTCTECPGPQCPTRVGGGASCSGPGCVSSAGGGAGGTGGSAGSVQMCTIIIGPNVEQTMECKKEKAGTNGANIGVHAIGSSPIGTLRANDHVLQFHKWVRDDQPKPAEEKKITIDGKWQYGTSSAVTPMWAPDLCTMAAIQSDESVTVDWACVDKLDADYRAGHADQNTATAHVLKAVRDGKAD